MEALRELGYDSYASILDIIDNCIDAHAAKIDIEIGEQKGDIVITIDDDGTGMDEETLREALRLGSDTEREPGDLGKFGMGLVTASIGLSQQVEVLTKENEGRLLFGGFDLEQIASENRFVKWVGTATREQIASFPREKGTRVRLSKTDRISNRNATTFANTLRPRIGQVFRKFLKSGVTIKVNGRAVEPIDPLMLSDPKTLLVLDTEIEVDGKGSAILRVVDLPDDVRNAVGRIQAQIRIHLARAVAVRGDLPAAQIDGLKAGPDLLDRLVPGEGPEGADTAFRLQETPQTSGAPFGEGVPDADRSPEPDDVVRPVRPDDARPPFIHFPVRFQTPGLIDHAVDRLLLCE